MFDDLYDALSLIFSPWWPTAEGEIIAVDFVPQGSRGALQSAVAYKFSLGDDGPFTGESLLAGKTTLRVGQGITVRYRSDDPSINGLEWRDMDAL